MKVKVTNFGSYKDLEFDFSSAGLALIHGDTGSGKSTLQDIIPWILFGQSSKGGKADDIRSWDAEQPTTGVLELGELTITRIRGKSGQNDLFWIEKDDAQLIRGKDITETQILLYNRLGYDYSQFLSASCFNEFSPTGNFFTAKSKERRELFETLVDLSLPVKIVDKSTQNKKDTKRELLKAESALAKLSGRKEELEKTIASLVKRHQNFEKDKEEKLNSLSQQYQEWQEFNQSQILQLHKDLAQAEKDLQNHKVEVCATCGNTVGDTEHYELQRPVKRLTMKLGILQGQTNPIQAQLLSLDISVNHYSQQIEEAEQNLHNIAVSLSALTVDSENLSQRLIRLDRLMESGEVLRVELLRKAVQEVQYLTNKSLDVYFDAELRVEFSLKDGDTLDITIQKNGHECVYKQLSKGQRQLLKLSFCLAVMKISSNNLGKHFDHLFFDESLDGMDTNLKLKAFRLFEELSLSHKNIFIIDHSQDLRILFTKCFEVTMVADVSRIQELE